MPKRDLGDVAVTALTRPGAPAPARPSHGSHPGAPAPLTPDHPDHPDQRLSCFFFSFSTSVVRFIRSSSEALFLLPLVRWSAWRSR